MERKLTRFLTLLVSLLVLVSLCTTTVFAEEADIKNPVCYYHGDVNGDGVISKSDALYVLYYSLLGDLYPDRYPVTQDFDYHADGNISKADALYLLYASIGDENEGTENYPLKGLVHDYYDPFWTWEVNGDSATATLTFRCGCRQRHVLGADEGLVVDCEITPATCVAAGKIEFAAKVTYEGKEYSDTHAVVLPISGMGHDMVGEQGCETESVCSLCGHTLPALGHSWVLNLDEEKTYAATCTEMGQQWYDCACGASHTVEIGTVPHTHAFSASGEPVLKEGTDCTYVVTNTYKCVCGDKITADSEYDKHSYKAVVTQEATCAATGVKAYVCEYCGLENGQTETIPVNADAHSWNDGIFDEVTGITTHTCSVCGGEKTAVTVAKDAAVSKEQLANELQLENANVSLDEQTVAELDDEKEIKISITEADLDSTGLSAEQKEQVGDNTVYDFSMTYTDGTAITNFAGKVKVSLPYTLGEGEDIDSIDIWYIDDQGNPARMKGTYANGYVTFETDHFSYYTVTRLTPAERCDRYGHIWIAAEKAATCTEEGYTKDVCQRCGSEENVKAIPALEHKYTDASDAAPATCTDAGLKHQVCERCNHEIEEEIPALGHNPVVDEEHSRKADCYNHGKEAKKCDREGCDYTSVVELPQRQHDFGENPKETVYPDCTTDGHDHQKCTLCEQDIISNETAPLGHNYAVAAENGWKWNEDKSEVEINLVCRNNDTHTKTIKATITKKSEAATCTGNGSVTYTATATFNGNTFTETVTVPVEALGHQTSGEWQTTESGHYRNCSVCGKKADQADHNWNTVVTKKPTCAATGTAENTCIICGYTDTETIPATGMHDLVGGECTVCGFEEDSCEHIRMNEVPLDLSEYDICEGFEAYAASCECGENQSLGFTNSNCSWGEEIPGTKKLADGRIIDIVSQTCTECGLTVEYASMFWTEDEEICRSYYSWYYGLSIDGQTIKEAIGVDRSGMMYWDHRANVLKETVDLSTLGICAGKLNIYTCRCGVALQVDRVDNECEYGDSNVCTVCGVNRGSHEYIGFEDAGCVGFEKVTYTLSKDGQAIYTCDCKYAYASHDNQVVKYVMDGESCEDGIMIYYVCADCGYKETAYFMYHATVIEEVTDLTGYGSCATASHQFVCACGAEKWGRETYNGQFVAVGELAHNMTLISEDTETGTRVLLCSKCNYTETIQHTQSKKDENCYYLDTTTYTFTDGKGHNYSYVNEYETCSHNYQREVILKGTTCNDGIEVRRTCADCGTYYIQNEYYGHMAFETQRYDLTAYGMCGGEAILYECPCGTYAMLSRYDQCKWEWLDGTENSSTHRCVNCGVTMEEKWEALYKITDCLQRSKMTTTFSKDEEVLLEISYTTDESTHRSVYSFELLDPSQGCGGGYRISETCLTCGMEADWGDDNIWYHHESFPVAREIVSVNQLCGDLEMVTYSCACGLDSWVNTEWKNGRCQFQWNGNAETCVECGAVYTERGTMQNIEGETCKKQAVTNIKIDKNGKNICDYSHEKVVTEHSRTVTYTLLGETCDDGYTYTVSCSACGELLEENTEVQYGCELRTVETITVATSSCGDGKIYVQECACGNNKDAWFSSNCWFDQWEWDEKRDCSKGTCVNCGLAWYEKQSWEHIDGTCTANRTFDYSFEMDGEEVGVFQGTYVVEDHAHVATFELFGATCEDGYYVTNTCVRCGDSFTHEGRGHGWYQTGYYDLSEYGMCGGEVWTYGCACGQNDGDYSWNWDCQWEHKNYDDATGTTTYYCSGCSTYRYRTNNGQRDPATCTYSGTEVNVFERDDVTLLTFTRERNYESHDIFAESLTLLNPEGNCEDGVTVTEKCADCDYTYTGTYYDHRCYETHRIDLSDGCGGVLRFGECACGQDGFFSREFQCENMTQTWNDWTDDDGIYHNHYVVVCSDCGLTIDDDWYTIREEDSCYVTTHETYTVTYGSETYVWERTYSYDSHDEVTYLSGTLYEGATSCEDGVWIQWQCNKCGEYGEYGYSHHELIAGESIDLGSYCGATLDLYSCVCGERRQYDIGADSECDVHRQHTDHWIDGVINDTQYTSEGYIGTYSNAYLLKCAVSDPVACGMTIRMSEYWLNENCMAVEYQTWQLGYDEETGTYDREITIATGEKHAYHPYVRTKVNETLDDGSTKNGYRDECPNCGSYAYQYDYWDQDGLYTKYERHFVNTLYETNGENRERYEVSEYGFVANDHNYETYYKNGYIHADGSEEWWQREYSNYDFSNNDCKRTVVETNSDGYTYTGTTSAHIVTCRYYNDPEPTCSQNGIEHHVHDCVVCGKEEELHDTWNLDPTCHYWNWDDDKGVYVCSTCELESAVGATGSICLEDLTEETDSVYTIGYWNPDNIEVTPTVSVILDDVTEDKEWVLTGIAFDYLTVEEDGIRALTFSKADAQAVAEAKIAELSYSGSYAIRISFVPDNGGDTLDYAITFDSQNTAQ